MKKKHNKKCAPQFSYKERVQIETYVQEGVSKREIARKLKREPSSVRYEIKQNSVRGTYIAEKAQLKAYQRRWRAKSQVLKVAVTKVLKEYVQAKTKAYWTPELIAGRIAYVDTHLPRVGKDAIYAYLESPHGRPLLQYRWHKGRAYKARIPRTHIANRISIDERPKSVGARRSYGHWEGDFIVSGKRGSGALLVLVERKSRYLIICKLSDRKVSTVNAVIAAVFGGGQLVVDSLTIDNDISFQKHEEMSALIGAPIYFCHPYHSWEKGTVEKINQLIRRFIPKGTNIARVNEIRVKEVEHMLNNRPMKCLKYLTPTEALIRSPRLKQYVERINQKEYHQCIKN